MIRQKNNCEYCIAELTFILDELNKASDNILKFPRISTGLRTLDKKNIVYLYTGFIMLPLAPKQWNGAETALGLRYGDCRFLSKANCGEKNLQSGAKGEGRLGFRKQDIFFFA